MPIQYPTAFTLEVMQAILEMLEDGQAVYAYSLAKRTGHSRQQVDGVLQRAVESGWLRMTPDSHSRRKCFMWTSKQGYAQAKRFCREGRNEVRVMRLLLEWHKAGRPILAHPLAANLDLSYQTVMNYLTAFRNRGWLDTRRGTGDIGGGTASQLWYVRYLVTPKGAAAMSKRL